MARRIAAPGFDPTLCWYALDAGQVVAYVQANANGRVSYPWCRKGHEAAADALFEHMIKELPRRNRQGVRGLPGRLAESSELFPRARIRRGA